MKVPNHEERLKIVLFDPNNLSAEIEKHPALFDYWAGLSTDAEMSSSMAELRADTIKAQKFKECKDTYGKSDMYCGMYAKSHPDYIQAMKEAIRAKHNAGILRNVREGLWQRKGLMEKEADRQRFGGSNNNSYDPMKRYKQMKEKAQQEKSLNRQGGILNEPR